MVESLGNMFVSCCQISYAKIVNLKLPSMELALFELPIDQGKESCFSILRSKETNSDSPRE